MSWKRSLITLLDRNPTRPLLASAVRSRASRLLGNDVKVWFQDGLWLHQLGRYIVPDGTRFDYDSVNYLSWKDEISRYFHNADDFWFTHYRPKPGDVVVDIGAGRGEDSLPFSEAVGPTGRVVAIEADPASCRILEGFCAVNQLRNVKPLMVALMDREGTVTIADSAAPWEQTTVGWSARGSVTVPAKTLDQICREENIGGIDFLKMNIEGAETSALLGMHETLPKIRNLCICCHDFRAERGHGEHYRTRAVVEKTLTAAGFRLSSRPNAPHDFLRDHVYGQRAA